VLPSGILKHGWLGNCPQVRQFSQLQLSFSSGISQWSMFAENGEKKCWRTAEAQFLGSGRGSSGNGAVSPSYLSRCGSHASGESFWIPGLLFNVFCVCTRRVIQLSWRRDKQAKHITIPVVPARGGAEVALKIYITPFSSIELACAVRQPSPCVRALCETDVVFHMSHLKLHFTLHSWQSAHSTLHTSHCTLHTALFALHTPLTTTSPPWFLVKSSIACS
jgi:hypothetical protein